MKKRKRNQKSTLLRVLETICGFLFAIALMLLIWDIQLKQNRIPTNTGNTVPPATPYVESTNRADLHIDENATRDGPPPVEIKGISIPGYKEITISAGKETVAVDFFNPEENAGKYYLSFELRVPDVNGVYNTLFASDLIEAGKHLYQITLNQALSAGIYERSILHIQPYTVNNLTPTNNADVEFTLYVK